MKKLLTAVLILLQFGAFSVAAQVVQETTYSYDSTGNRTTTLTYNNLVRASHTFTPNDTLSVETIGTTTKNTLNLAVNNLPITTISTSLNTPSTTEHLYTNHLASVVATRGSTTTNTTHSPFGVLTSSGILGTNRGYIGEDLDSTGL